MDTHQIFHHLMPHLRHGLMHILAFHQLNAMLKNHLALIIHHIVIFEQIFPDVEIARLNLGLRPLQRLVDPGMNNRLALFKPQFLQHAIHARGAKNPHQIIFKRQIEFRAPLTTLPP